MGKLRYRQVHLDFHTSGLIPDIGKQFDKNQFKEALKAGHVDSITIFSKCHHGWVYHPTKVHEIHPHLTFDLLKAQLEACKEMGVKAPVYISAGLDEKEAVRHPEWLSRLSDETTTWVSDFTKEADFHLLCFNTDYFKLLLSQIKEVMENYEPEGIFLDISAVHPCYCSKCRNDILERGKDPRDIEAVMEQAEMVYKNYGVTIEKLIHSYNKDCTIFHNAGHITRGRRDIAGYNTHLELESLPTGGWGYDHFPMSAAYVSNIGMEYLGMTGKFHNAWGEFGGFKHPNALLYETSLSLAFGAKSSIGDQLHPSGEMNVDTYHLIGKAYEKVEQKEPWCVDAINQFDIGILSEEAVNNNVSDRNTLWNGDVGANRIMLEGNYLYRLIDLQADFQEFKLIILPDNIKLNKQLEDRLKTYLANGGKVLATGISGTNSQNEFVLDFGAKFLGKSKYLPDYLIPEYELTTGRTPHVMYEEGYDIEMGQGTLLAFHQASYFNRDVYQFCSHQHTPNEPQNNTAAISITSNTAYIGWKIFSDYAKNGSLHLKETVVYVLDQLLGTSKTLTTNLLDRGIVTLTKQEEQGRYINHLLFAHTTLRGKFGENPIEVIEDIVPIYDINVTLCIEEASDIRKVVMVPQNIDLDYSCANNSITYTVPKIHCHQMVSIEF